MKPKFATKVSLITVCKVVSPEYTIDCTSLDDLEDICDLRWRLSKMSQELPKASLDIANLGIFGLVLFRQIPVLLFRKRADKHKCGHGQLQHRFPASSFLEVGWRKPSAFWRYSHYAVLTMDLYIYTYPWFSHHATTTNKESQSV